MYRTFRSSALLSERIFPIGSAVTFTEPCDGNSGGSGRKIIHLLAAKVLVVSS